MLGSKSLLILLFEIFILSSCSIFRKTIIIEKAKWTTMPCTSESSDSIIPQDSIIMPLYKNSKDYYLFTDVLNIILHEESRRIKRNTKEATSYFCDFDLVLNPDGKIRHIYFTDYYSHDFLAKIMQKHLKEIRLLDHWSFDKNSKKIINSEKMKVSITLIDSLIYIYFRSLDGTFYYGKKYFFQKNKP
ncbi:MAG: hypothetical protein MUC49_11640 [Raineya sp.]|jgi:hypothetical protein|nr:hypothetical protein [Raineya sp.]